MRGAQSISLCKSSMNRTQRFPGMIAQLVGSCGRCDVEMLVAFGCVGDCPLCTLQHQTGCLPRRRGRGRERRCWQRGRKGTRQHRLRRRQPRGRRKKLRVQTRPLSLLQPPPSSGSTGAENVNVSTSRSSSCWLGGPRQCSCQQRSIKSMVGARKKQLAVLHWHSSEPAVNTDFWSVGTAQVRGSGGAAGCAACGAAAAWGRSSRAAGSPRSRGGGPRAAGRHFASAHERYLVHCTTFSPHLQVSSSCLNTRTACKIRMCWKAQESLFQVCIA